MEVLVCVKRVPETGARITLTADAQEGAKLQVQYMGERYPVTVEVVGARSLFDPENTRVRA